MATFFKAIRNTVKYWYIPTIVGILLIVLGVYLFTVPLKTYMALTMLFSISFLVTGILDTYFSIQNKDELEGWGWYLASGLFSILLGILLIAMPSVAATTLPFFVGFSLLFRSFQGLGFAFELKNYGVLRWGNLAIASILGIVFSMLLIASPVFTGMSLAVLTAMSFIFSGIAAIVLSFQLKKLKSFPSKISKEVKDKIENLKKEYYEILNERKD